MEMKKTFLSENTKSVLINTLLVIPVIFFSLGLSYPFGKFLLWAINDISIDWVEFAMLVGVPYAGIFFTFLIFTLFGRK